MTERRQHGKRHLTKAQVRKARERYERGKRARLEYKKITMLKIAEKFDVHVTTIEKIDKVAYTPGKYRHKLSIEDVDLIMELLEEMHKWKGAWLKDSVAQIARDLGVRKSLVTNMVLGKTYKNWT